MTVAQKNSASFAGGGAPEPTAAGVGSDGVGATLNVSPAPSASLEVMMGV